ncbi:MAG: hypothetical protein AAGA90_04020 [Actinomycetota bacterium]
MRRDVWWTAVLALVVLVAAACGGSSDDDDGTEVGAESTAAASTAATNDDGDGGEDSAEAETPADDGADDEASSASQTADDDGGDGSGTVEITEDMSVEEITELLFPTFDENSIEEQQAQWEDEERQRQQLIAECMAGQGFEYIPVDYGDQAFFGGIDDEIDPTSREWAETYGFGYTTFTFDEGEIEADPWVDPNQDYIDGLSDSARDAYFAALYGTPPEFDPNLTEEEYDQLFEENPELFEPQGCDGEAWEATNSYAQFDDVYLALNDEFEELYERVEADARIASWQQEWAECMVGKGHAYADMDDMYEHLGERSNELWNYDEWEDPTAGMTEEEIENLIDTSTEEELAEFFAGPEPDPELQAEIQEWEIALAVDSFDCGGNSQWELWEEIYAEYQQVFIEENLDAIQAALAGNG